MLYIHWIVIHPLNSIIHPLNNWGQLKAALISGFKNSGIVIGKKANVIVAVRSTQSLEVPLVHKGELMVSDKYIEFLVNVANKKLEENQTRIDRFFKNLSQLLSECNDSHCTLQKTGKTPIIKDSRLDKLSTVHVANGTSSPANLDAPEPCEEDALDCLESFYGEVS
ncbi:hypothetical protein ACROYT_G003366 [Oculina patagonica]